MAQGADVTCEVVRLGFIQQGSAVSVAETKSLGWGAAARFWGRQYLFPEWGRRVLTRIKKANPWRTGVTFSIPSGPTVEEGRVDFEVRKLIGLTATPQTDIRFHVSLTFKIII